MSTRPAIRPYRSPLAAAAAGDVAYLRHGLARARFEARREQVKALRLPAADPDVEYRDAFATWLGEELRGVDQMSRSKRSRRILERRTDQSLTGAAGGYLAPQSFYDEVVTAAKYASPVRELARTWVSDSGTDAPLPQVDDTANVGAILAENAPVTSLAVAFTQRTLKGYAYQSQLITASWQLLQDAAFPLEETFGGLMGLRIGRIQNAHFTTGTGTGQPEGFVNGGTVGVTLGTGATTTLGTAATAYGSLIDLTASVDPAYRRHPSCAWQMADATWTAIRKLADTATLPFFEDSDAPGGTPMLLGWPVYINNDMATMAASAKTIAFGAWQRHYAIRDVGGLSIKVLRERFADQLQSGVYGYLRSDGKVADPKAVRLLAQSAT